METEIPVVNAEINGGASADEGDSISSPHSSLSPLIIDRSPENVALSWLLLGI